MRRGLAGAAVIVCAVALQGTAAAGVPAFDREQLDIHDFHVFDLGTADYDGDGDSDLYTTNHLGRQSLLANNGAGQFTESLFQAGLAQTREFPGWEDREGPHVNGPGLYLEARSGLRMRHVGEGRARGTVAFLFPTRVSTEGQAHAKVRRERRPGADRYVATFRLDGDSKLQLDPLRKAHPYRVHLRPPLPLEEVFVGSQDLHPHDRRFQLYLRDRHAMAWADLGGSSATDVFVVRGGLRGEIRNIVGEISDELFFGSGGEFHPAGIASSLKKGACRGRVAGAVDLTGDGRLDLYSTCEGRKPKVYRATAGGSFEQSGALQRTGLRTESMRFLALDNDPEPELLATFEHHFEVYERGAGGWALRQSIPARHSVSRRTQLAAADADADGDLDLYVAATSGSTFLRNEGGTLHARDPGSFGLPGQALAAAWGDADNDGDQDLATFPGGLREQGPGFQFTNAAGLPVVDKPVEARIAWPDLDGDGDRDPVISGRDSDSARLFRTYEFTSQGPSGHWLEVDLHGRRGNRQAVGARVRVTAAGERQTGWVAQNETSVYSQGHYRLYFGLGAATSADVEVRWPNGRVRDLGTVAADQLLEPDE